MMRHRMHWLVLAVLIVALLAGCGAGEPAASTDGADVAGTDGTTATGEQAAGEAAIAAAPLPEIIAKVNGQEIDRTTFERQAARFQAALISQGYSFSGEEGKKEADNVRRQVLESMIDEMLIEQAAKNEGVELSQDVMQTRIDMDVQAAGGQEKFEQSLQLNGLSMEEYQRMIHLSVLTEEMLRRLSNTLPEKLKQVHIRQILVETEAEAKEIRGQLDAGADFATLAQERSRDESTRAAGGDRGFLPLGYAILPAEVESAIATLGAGQLAGPITALPYGYYLIQVVEVDEARSVDPTMRQGLTKEKYAGWVQGLRAGANIERFVEWPQ